LLESTAQLGKVAVVGGGDEMWVKLCDLTEGAHLVIRKAPRKPGAKDRPASSANSSYRTIRAL
jgi:hypothetical protein